jgi:hypothetical protein
MRIVSRGLKTAIIKEIDLEYKNDKPSNICISILYHIYLKKNSN